MIRKANINDLDAIWALRLKTTFLLKKRGIDQWQYLEPNKKRFIQDIQNESFFVYEINHKIIAMMYIQHEEEKTYKSIDGKWHANKPYFTIHRLAIDEQYLGQGISLELLTYAKTYAKSHHIFYLRIDTHKDNQQAKRLFMRCGYQLCGTILLEENHQGDRKRLAFDYILGDET
jgi:ribosomal protein S18 acetylase RimI-like enzyme